MSIFKNFKDISASLRHDGEIDTNERFRWWTGVIDGCLYCGIINFNETDILLEQLEKQTFRSETKR